MTLLKLFIYAPRVKMATPETSHFDKEIYREIFNDFFHKMLCSIG